MTVLRRIHTYLTIAGLSDILYHATGIHNLYDILKTNKFALSTSLGSTADNDLHNNASGKTFFLSTTRSRVGCYHYPTSKGQYGQCLLVLDGRKLMADGFSGGPVDYWGPLFERKKNEMEDRVVSARPNINNASKYIKECHIYLDTNTPKRDTRLHGMVRLLRKTLLLAKTSHLPVYVYADNKDFNLLRKNRAVPVSGMNLEAEPPPPPYPAYPRRNPYSYKEYGKAFHSLCFAPY